MSKETRSSSFALVTSLAAAVVAATAALDLLTGSINLSWWWTSLVIGTAGLAAAVPYKMGARFPPRVALVSCWLFGAVTSVQIADSSDVVMTINNLVLYPMVSCYLGWFFTHRTARATVVGLYVCSGAALIIDHSPRVFTTWANLALASFFCLEAASYLRGKLDQQIETDPLTGALNRFGLASRMSAELLRSAQTNNCCAVALIDLDAFKVINDTMGHAAGDAILTSLVDELHASKRPQDSLARIGGDEFVLLLPHTTAEEAEKVASRVQSTSGCSWTFGVSQSRSSDTSATLLARADDDLYQRKKKRWQSDDSKADYGNANPA